MRDVKTVGYCYHTSMMADDFNRGETGCHYVEFLSLAGDKLDGPFDTARDAEQHAEQHYPEADWSWMYVANPLPGSQFEQAAKWNKSL